MTKIEQEPSDSVYASQRSLESTEFKSGQIVSPKSNPSLRGVIVGIIPGQPENRYSVFQSGATVTYYASQIQAEPEQDQTIEVLPLSQFHAHLTALQIRHPGLSILYSLNAARVDFIPYQFRPVLKFIRSERPRLLIADSVGVGKTIEAGLILRELQARRDVKSVLIICPKPLITERKWELEMRRFDERFTHLDGNTMRYCINETDLDGVWPEQHARTIIPYSLFDETLLHGSPGKNGKRRTKGLLDLDPPPRFDLAIVDEAHHIRNTDTFAYKAVRFFCDNSEAVLFLTATPIQLCSDDLFVLLNVLRPDLVIDKQSFEHMAAPNPHINRAVDLVRGQPPVWQDEARAALTTAAATPWGQAVLMNNPEFQRIYSLLGGKEISVEDRVSTIGKLEEMHTFSGIVNRTRRRDIGDFTVRRPETVTVDFTTQQRQFHDGLMRVQANILARLHGDQNVKFMMTTIRRQAASCLFGLVPFLEDILTRRIDDLTWEEADEPCDSPDMSFTNDIETQIRDLLRQAQQLDPYDPKLEALHRIIRDKQRMSNNKIIVYSSFRHTLSYLFKHLNADGFRIGLVHGNTPDEDRVELRNRFCLSKEDADALDVFLFSEVGTEGLDYQFCDCIANYDLPWNPMRIEQRIGRIDRNGQRSETVAIYNLITPGTVDADIYERCMLRIGVFNKSLGECEEILGQITREVRDVGENLNLSDAERNAKLQQIADNKIRLIHEQQDLEERQVDLFGIRLPTDQTRKEIEAASSFWLSPVAIENLVSQYLNEVCGQGQEYILGEKALKTLRLSQEVRSRLLQDFQHLPRQTSASYREWEVWLKGANPHLTITFDAVCATEHPDAAFVTPVHPLVRQAAMIQETKQCIMTTVAVADRSVPPGDYPFAIYEWRFHGIREDLILRPVSQNEAITARLIQLLEKSEPVELVPSEIPNRANFDALESQHYELWAEARNKHQDSTHQLVQFRRESLTTSHKARLALLNEQLSQATDERIRRMRQSQIKSAEADFDRRLQELDAAIAKADITAQPVAFGVIRVTGR